MNAPSLHIGIDPGVTTGYAIWNKTKQNFEKIISGSFWDIIVELEAAKTVRVTGLATIKVVIEDPNLNPTTHNREAFSMRTMDRKAQNVGSNKRDASLLIEYLERHEFELIRVKPSRSNRKINQETFKAQTRWAARTNQHERDAAMLCFGR
jgi:hypothetical protein